MNRLASILALAASLVIATPACADQILPPGRITQSNDILFGALKLGKREGNKTVITPDTLQILGKGSTGEASLMSVTPDSTAPADTLARRLHSPTFPGPVVAQDKITAPYVLPAYRGIRLSEFLTSNDWSVDQRAQAQAALNKLLGGEQNVFDCEGRTFSISAPLTFGAANQTGWPRQIINCNIIAAPDFPVGGSLLDLSGAGPMYNVSLVNVSMNGAGRANWIKFPPKYFGFSILGGYYTAPNTVGFDDFTASGGDSHELLIDNARFNSEQYAAGGQTRGIMKSKNADIILNNIIGQHFAFGFDLSSAAYQFSNVHVWAEGAGDGKGAPAFILRNAGAGPIAFSNLYLDNTYVVLANEVTPTLPIGKVTFTGTSMLATALTTDPNFAFVRLKPTAVNTAISDIVMQGSQFGRAGGSSVTTNIAVDTSAGGSIDASKVRRLNIFDPYVNIPGGQHWYTTKGTVRRYANGVSSLDVDLSAVIPPFTRANGFQVGMMQYNGTNPGATSITDVLRLTTNTVRISFSRTANVMLTIGFDCSVNEDEIGG